MKHTSCYTILSLSVLFFSACSKSNSSSSTAKVAVVTTFAGSGSAGTADGQGTAAQFDHPYGVAIDGAGNLYIGDENNALIRKITSAAAVTTLAGSTYGYADGTGSAAKFFGPDGVAVDASGNIYVADEVNNRIRKVSPSGVVTTLAGGSTAGYADGTGTAALFSGPTGVAVDGAGNVYVADSYNHRIRKITAAGVVTTVAGSGTTGPGNGGYADGAAGSALFEGPSGLTVDGSGNIFVADYGNFKIRKINTAGIVSTVAGSVDGETDGTGTAAEFGGPIDLVVDGSDNLFVTDQLGTIRKVTAAGVVTTIAGAAGSPTANAFAHPAGIAIDGAGNLYVADYSGYVIRKISFQ